MGQRKIHNNDDQHHLNDKTIVSDVSSSSLNDHDRQHQFNIKTGLKSYLFFNLIVLIIFLSLSRFLNVTLTAMMNMTNRKWHSVGNVVMFIVVFFHLDRAVEKQQQ